MAVFSIDDAVLIAVVGLTVKEGANLWLKYKSKKNGNGKDNLRGILEDIKGTGKLTLSKVGDIEKEQGLIKLDLKGVMTDMVTFKEKCISLDKDVTNLDQRIFDHVKAAGGK